MSDSQRQQLDVDRLLGVGAPAAQDEVQLLDRVELYEPSAL